LALPIQGRTKEYQMKNQAAVELGRRGGLARKRNLTPEELTAIGKRGAAIRWAKKKRKKQDEKKHA
jgi:hypothetical protein